MELLKILCAIHAPSGDEGRMTDFLLDYIKTNKKNWNNKPKVFSGGMFQDAIVLVFGKPRTAIFAHIDSIGFTTRYQNQLVKIGGPVTTDGIRLVSEASSTEVVAELKTATKAEFVTYTSTSSIERGTNLTFFPDFRETEDTVQCCYMDNRLGVWSALQVAETLKHGIIVFSCREEHSGGSTAHLGQWIYENYRVSQALISDITWVTDGVQHGEGVVISMRDSGLPRRKFLDKVISIARHSKIAFQLEVEGSGGSDGIELQKSAAPWEWCFVGAAESNVHSPDELVHKADIRAMVFLYKYLMKEL